MSNYSINLIWEPCKLLYKSKLIKRYDKPKTPFQRVIESKEMSDKTKRELKRVSNEIDPFRLQQEIKEKVVRILNQSTLQTAPENSTVLN